MVMKKRHLVELPVFQDIGNELNGQHRKIAGQTERHLREHGMHVGMPENKPSPQRLADIDGQNQQCRTVADKPDDHGKVDDVFQLIHLEDIFEQARKKRPASQSDHGQVRPDPQRKPVIVVHVGLVQPLEPAQQHGIHAPEQDRTHNGDPQHEFGE
jgi:hypothetical protein